MRAVHLDRAWRVLAGYFSRQEREDSRRNLVLQARNFYGALEVRDDLPTEDYRRAHPLARHHQPRLTVAGPDACATSPRRITAKRSGVGRAMNACRQEARSALASIGLGAGVLSNYGRNGDYFRIYEINPLVERIAQTQFYFLSAFARGQEVF